MVQAGVQNPGLSVTDNWPTKCRGPLIGPSPGPRAEVGGSVISSTEGRTRQELFGGALGNVPEEKDCEETNEKQREPIGEVVAAGAEKEREAVVVGECEVFSRIHFREFSDRSGGLLRSILTFRPPYLGPGPRHLPPAAYTRGPTRCG